ncbi:MAG: RNA polymerase sigma-54 factor [Planctomycetota bacterium]|nr:MAG: RNA polymerase sigma-54 factor [Planctomycetota bacterium]
MRMSFGQEMRMAQKQVLAPRMIQSMEILQLPMMALEERIEQEIQNNETLELDEPEGDNQSTAVADGGSSQDGAPDPSPERTVDERPLVVDQDHANQADFERSYDWSNEYPESDDDRSRPSSGRIDEASDRYLDAMANMEERPETLFHHLHEQLSNYELGPEDRLAAEKVIYNLDANGYLPMPLEGLVELEPAVMTAPEEALHGTASAAIAPVPLDGPAKQLERLERGLAVVQGMEPAGVGARDLRECLLLQIRSSLPHARQLQRLVSDHLEDLAANRLPLIARKTGLSIEEIETLRRDLHMLQPKPGARFTVPYVPVVKPDVHVEQLPDGIWKVRLEDVNLPNLRISPLYREMLAAPGTPPETREYIKRKINSAQWLIEAIEQRRSTLLKTAQAIVDHQTRFLADGPESIEPLKMQQIADRIGMHVTTVSRAVDDKWLQTPRGLVALRRFFVGGTVSADGDEVAWDTVRIKLQEIIQAESKDAPLSDDDLVDELGKGGITVARRTVTKYRKAMDIPSSRQRRDWKLATPPRVGQSPPVVDGDRPVTSGEET